MNAWALLLLLLYRRCSLGGRIAVTNPRLGWVVPTKSKAGEGTRCRRARTSCQRRTCGRLRFVIGQCAAGRSPHPHAPNEGRSQLAPGSRGGRGLPTCRWRRDSLLKRLCGAGQPRGAVRTSLSHLCRSCGSEHPFSQSDKTVRGCPLRSCQVAAGHTVRPGTVLQQVARIR